MTKKQFAALRAKQDLSDLHYNSAKEWMWDYCLFLGKFTDSKGRNYDIGIHFNGENCDLDYKYSDATVYEDNPGSYSSGFMNHNMIPTSVDGKPNTESKTMLDWYIEKGFEANVECWYRLQSLLKTLDTN